MIFIKKNISQNSEILAVCDQNLVGKHFKENNLKLDITEGFYKGDLLSEEEVINLMKRARNINIVGKDSIKLAIKAKIIEKECIIKIKSIPHAIVFEI